MARKTTILMYDGDDFETLAELRREVDVAERAAAAPGSPNRLGDPLGAAVAVKRAKDAYDVFVDEAAERAEEWELHPIGHEEFRDLLKDHPPRTVDGEPHPDDLGIDVNTDTFPKALLQFVDPDDNEYRTVVAPKFDTEAAFRKRIKRLSAGEFDSLWMAAYWLNEGAIADPKLSRFSPADQRLGEISESPARLG